MQNQPSIPCQMWLSFTLKIRFKSASNAVLNLPPIQCQFRSQNGLHVETKFVTNSLPFGSLSYLYKKRNGMILSVKNDRNFRRIVPGNLTTSNISPLHRLEVVFLVPDPLEDVLKTLGKNAQSWSDIWNMYDRPFTARERESLLSVTQFSFLLTK